MTPLTDLFDSIVCHYVPNLIPSQQERILKWLTTSCVLKTEGIDRVCEVTYPNRNSKNTMTVCATTPVDLCGRSSSEGYIIYVTKNKKRTATAICDELPALLTRYFGLEQCDGAESMVACVVRLDTEESVAALDKAGIASVPEGLEKMISRMNLMRTARTRCKEEARWAFASWVKKEVLGVEGGKEGHRL